MCDVDVLYFGYKDVPGHYLHSKVNPSIRCEKTPWGKNLDSGLLTPNIHRVNTMPTGRVVTHRKDGWTAIAYWDRSGDSRSGSNSVFLVKADITGQQLFDLAKVQWPDIIERWSSNWPRLKVLDEQQAGKAPSP